MWNQTRCLAEAMFSLLAGFYEYVFRKAEFQVRAWSVLTVLATTRLPRTKSDVSRCCFWGLTAAGKPICSRVSRPRMLASLHLRPQFTKRGQHSSAVIRSYTEAKRLPPERISSTVGLNSALLPVY